MSAKPAYAVIRERLLNWFLFQPKTFDITVDQLADILYAMERQARLGWGKGSKREKLYELLEHLQKVNKLKHP